MKIYTPFVALAVLCAALTSAVGVRADENEMKEIQARARAIAPTLQSSDAYGAKTFPREKLEQIASLRGAKQVVKAADEALKASNPELPEELYKEYYKNGNRSNYQGAYGRLTRRINVFALAEAFVDDGKYVDALNDAILFLCSLPSWVLPAHDANAGIYDGKTIYSDLGSTLAAGNLAVAINLHGAKLPKETVELAKAEIEKRILAPYRNSVANKPVSGMWWIRTHNNWNAVCHAGTIAAALNVVDSPEDRAFYLAAADYFSENNFMKGFTNDGYCSEGMGYWNYGVGNYLILGALCRTATNGALDLFRFSKMRAILDYAPTLEIDRGNYAVFADCAMTAKPYPLYVGYLSRLKGYGYTGFEAQGLGENFPVGDLMQTSAFGFDTEITFAEAPQNAEKFALPIRTEFPDAGVMICRPNPNATGKYFAAAFKAGHNAEMHNHNDVGSYTLVLGDAADAKKPDLFVSRDPGGETYTARTFSSRRYEGQLLNSFGHPVPLVAGKLQSTGANAKGVVVEKSTTDELDVFAEEFSSAYDVKTLKSLIRKFEFARANGANAGYFKITDSVAFEEGAKETFETAIVTFEKAAIEENGDALKIKIGDAVVDVVAVDKSGKSLKLIAETTIVGEKDDSVAKKPTRVALRVDGAIESAVVTQTFAAAE